MENIINSKTIDKHLIKKYNFKVLGSSQSSSQKNFKEQEEREETTLQDDSDLGREIEKSESQKIKDSFITELLQKSDKLSSDIIKLQMQIEEGQKEFEIRLQQQTKEAFEEGERQGYEKAKNEMQKEIESLKAQYANSIKKLDDLYEKFSKHFEELKEKMSEAVFEIAKEVISKEISKNSKSVAYALTNELLDDIKDASKITLRVNPEDYEYIKEKFQEIENIEVSKDDAVSKGGVILLSDAGNIDGDIRTRVEKAKKLIVEQN